MDTQDDFGGSLLDVWPDRSESACQCNGADALRPDVPPGILQCGRIERSVLTTVIERSAAHEISMTPDNVDEVLWPSNHRGNAVGLWQGNANSRHLCQVAPLYESVD